MEHDFLKQDVLVSWLQRFVRHPSEQTDLHEADPAIKAFISDCVAPVFRDLGADYRFDGMGNLIIETGPGDSERSLLFLAYAMTHPANRMNDPFAASIVETPAGPAVRGRGVAEQKTALAALTGALAQTLADGKLRGRLTVALTTAGETGRHDAVRSVMDSLDAKPQFAVVCIGTDSKVAIGNKGRVDFDAVVGGKASHSSAPWKGVNALSGAVRVLESAEKTDLGIADHPEFGPATLTPTALKTLPNATHTVPDTARITFDRRLLPGEDPEEAFADVSSKLSLDAPWSLDFERGPVMYPNEIQRGGLFYAKLEQAYADAEFAGPDGFYCNFALDAGYFANAGVEAVMMGPGEIDQFHSDEENVLVSDLVGMARVYYGLIKACLYDDAR